MSYVIEDAVPMIPVNRWRSPVRLVLEKMEIDQSVLLSTHVEYRCARGFMSMMRPKRFSFRKLGKEGWRVWRVQ